MRRRARLRLRRCKRGRLAGAEPSSANRSDRESYRGDGDADCYHGMTGSTSGLYDRQPTTSSLRWCRRAALRVALCALCGVPDVVLHAPCVVPDAVLHGPRVVPDAVPYQTSTSQRKAWRASSGRQHLTPSELQARPQVQAQLRIQKEQERFDDRPASFSKQSPISSSRFTTLLHVAQIPERGVLI